MLSAKHLHDELAALSRIAGSTRDRDVSLDVLATTLHRRLMEAPEEAALITPPSPPPMRVAAAAAAARYRRNNVDLPWPAESEAWTWPPELFVAYDRLFDLDVGLRVIGDGWGMSSINHPKRGGAVLVSVLSAPGPRVKWADDRRSSVRCLLGATFEDVNQFLDDEAASHPSNLDNQPGFERLSVIGCIGAGGHGSGLGLGPLESMVEAVVLGGVEPPHTQVTIPRGDPRFDLAVTHLGRLGPIVAMDLRVRERFRIAEERTIAELGATRDWRDDLRMLVRRAAALHDEPDVHSTEIWLAPYVQRGSTVAALGVRRRTQEQPAPGGEGRPLPLRSRALQVLGQIAVNLVSAVEPRWIRALIRETVRATRTHRIVMQAREGLDFGAPNENPMSAIEMAIDVSDTIDRGVDALLAALDALEALRREKKRYVFAPMGVRFVGRGPARGLSPHAGRMRTMHVEIPTFADEGRFHGREVLEPLQRRLLDLGARPHWGQRIYVSGEELRARWPEASRREMRELVLAVDPRGVFANELVDAVLEL